MSKDRQFSVSCRELEILIVRFNDESSDSEAPNWSWVTDSLHSPEISSSSEHSFRGHPVSGYAKCLLLPYVLLRVYLLPPPPSTPRVAQWGSKSWALAWRASLCWVTRHFRTSLMLPHIDRWIHKISGLADIWNKLSKTSVINCCYYQRTTDHQGTGETTRPFYVYSSHEWLRCVWLDTTMNWPHRLGVWVALISMVRINIWFLTSN